MKYINIKFVIENTMWNEFESWDERVHVTTECSSIAFDLSSRTHLDSPSNIVDNTRICFINSNPIKDYLERVKEENEQRERER